jgi:hypothetical protein
MVEEGLKLKNPIFFLEEDVAYSWASIQMHQGIKKEKKKKGTLLTG